MSNLTLYAVKFTKPSGATYLGRLVPVDTEGVTYWVLDTSRVYPVWVVTDSSKAWRVVAGLTTGSNVYSPQPATTEGDKLEVVELHQ